MEEYLSCGHFAVMNEEDPNSIGSMSSMEALLSNEEELTKYFKKETFEKGQILFDIDDYADKVSSYHIFGALAIERFDL